MKKKIVALVHYKIWVDAAHPLLDGGWDDRSKVVEVEDLISVNDMFERITKIDILIK